MVIQPSIENRNRYVNPYYWVDDHPLLHGTYGSLDPSTSNIMQLLTTCYARYVTMLVCRLNASFLNDVWGCLSSSGWWFQPIWKIVVKLEIFPFSGWKKQIFELSPPSLCHSKISTPTQKPWPWFSRVLPKDRWTKNPPHAVACSVDTAFATPRPEFDSTGTTKMTFLGAICSRFSNLQFPTLSGVQYFQNQNPPL